MRNSAFTLVELLITIGIVAIVASSIVLVLNPSQMIMQARDATRMTELANLNRALTMYNVDQSGRGLGTPSIVYVSIPDPTLVAGATSTCVAIGLSASQLPTGWTYQCASSSTYRLTDGRGWLPVNFNAMTIKSPLTTLPVDPVNTTTSFSYYTYVTNGTQWEVTSPAESQKFQTNPTSAGIRDGLFARGTNLNLMPALPQGIPGLVAYYTFDEGSGNTVPDHSGYNNNAVANYLGGITYTNQAKVGSYARASGRVELSPITQLSNPVTTFTFAGWSYLQDDVGFDNLLMLGWDGSCGEGGIEYTNANAHINALGGTGGGYGDIPGSYLNTWVFNTLVVNNGIATFYINGVNVWSGIAGTGSFGTVSKTWVGDGLCDDGWYGRIDDVRFYNRALSSAEIQTIYNATK